MTTLNFDSLADETRLLIEADLQPLQGRRFQPTGFPDLGPAEYKLPKLGTRMVLLESAQSVANRLELTVWDEAKGAIVEPLTGLSYVVVEEDGKMKTNSLLEAHRLNSNYILESKDDTFLQQLKQELKVASDTAVDFHQLAMVLAKYDFNSLLHGIFLAKKELAGGRFKLARALSGFIEAANVEVVASGGVKNDRIDPKGDTKSGGGNVPFHREEYVAEKITAYFSLDLAQIRGYRLGKSVEDLLIALALWKVQNFLQYGLRLRTACDLHCEGIKVTRPNKKWALPSLTELENSLPDLIDSVKSKNVFADPAVTVVNYVIPKK
ncbi:MAG: type I-U CRISPR-associated protein Cas7 [Kamptonema sp. SIO4C4]|nr:type I-U CRISPR-associated protein Cas7 [Kamptonema sp. SIO4C4]